MAPYDGIRIYAAGKINQHGWRHDLFPVTTITEYVHPNQEPWPAPVPIRALPGATYVGPHFMGDDHGCFHGDNRHGVAAGGAACGDAYPGLSRPEVANRCLDAIRRCTHVFAWIDDTTAHGTLVELGYARALGRQAHVYMHNGQKELEDMWFVGQIATSHRWTATPADAFADFKLRLR